jgi:hypothetical protein
MTTMDHSWSWRSNQSHVFVFEVWPGFQEGTDALLTVFLGARLEVHIGLEALAV